MIINRSLPFVLCLKAFYIIHGHLIQTKHVLIWIAHEQVVTLREFPEGHDECFQDTPHVIKRKVNLASQFLRLVLIGAQDNVVIVVLWICARYIANNHCKKERLMQTPALKTILTRFSWLRILLGELGWSIVPACKSCS